MPELRKPTHCDTYLTLQKARDALMGQGGRFHNQESTMFDADVFSFAHGEGVRRPYPEALAAMVASLSDPDLLPIENYMFLQRHDELEAAIAADMVEIGVPADQAENVVIDAGTSRLIVAALELMTRPGDTVFTFSGFYHPLASWSAYRHLNLVVVPTHETDGHVPNASRLETAIADNPSPGASVLVLFNPSMTGAICTAKVIAQLAEVANRHGLWVIEDALFANCEHASSETSARFAASPAGDRVITVAGASKLHGLANMRIGWACANAHIASALSAYITSNAASIPQIAQIAALEALRAPRAFRRKNAEEIHRRLAVLSAAIEELNNQLRSECGLDGPPLVRLAHEPKAGHSLLLDFQGFADAVRAKGLVFRDSADLTAWFLGECKVAFSPAQSHGFNGFHLRANVASVGTALTYPASVAIERDWRGDWHDTHEASFEDPFEQGRQLLVSAIFDRVRPAMQRALSANTSISRPIRATGGAEKRANGGTSVNGIGSANGEVAKTASVTTLREAMLDSEAVFMDVWGVLTDGETVFEPALAALQTMKATDLPVILVSNTSRRGIELEQKLATLGIDRQDYTGVVTGGDLGFRCATERRAGNRAFGPRALVVGFQPGGDWTDEAGLERVQSVADADVLIGIGILDEADVSDQILEILSDAAERGLPFLVTNADQAVRIGARTHAGSGALAPHYVSFGGETFLFGKPNAEIYRSAARLAVERLNKPAVPPEKVLAVGDSFATDIAGAGAFGARTLLVTASGTHFQDLHAQDRPDVCPRSFARLCKEHDCAPDLMMRELVW